MKCQICDKECKTVGSLGNHIVKYHGDLKEYYDKFLKKENEGKCKVCGESTKYYRLNVGYRTTCGQDCSRKLMSMPDSRNKSKQTIFKKYGVENPSQIDGIGKIISEKAKLRLSDENERIRISKLTKEAMARPEVRENYLKSRKPISDEQKQKLSDEMKIRHLDINFKKKIYTEERNKKISDSKKIYWENNPEEKKRVGNIWKLLKERDEVGWRKHLMEASKKGFESIFSPNGDTSLEIKLYSMLSKENIIFIKKYELDGKVYDAYLPERNILIEIDGDFWHKQTLDECKYKYQTESYYNDIVKNDIAKNNNMRLIRIREKNMPITITELL
jgi:hypothetical protein